MEYLIEEKKSFYECLNELKKMKEDLKFANTR